MDSVLRIFTAVIHVILVRYWRIGRDNPELGSLLTLCLLSLQCYVICLSTQHNICLCKLSHKVLFFIDFFYETLAVIIDFAYVSDLHHVLELSPADKSQ